MMDRLKGEQVLSFRIVTCTFFNSHSLKPVFAACLVYPKYGSHLKLQHPIQPLDQATMKTLVDRSREIKVIPRVLQGIYFFQIED